MDLCLAPHHALSPLEALLTIYTPALETLVAHLSTQDKRSLSQTSRHLRQLLHSYPPFFAHLDFRLFVPDAAFDSYTPGTVYNLDSLLQSLPVDGRIVSLTLDWTAVSGYFLFNKIVDRCRNTLEHLSVRGCRKVSIKHHIVPHFVYQTSIQPLADARSGQITRQPVLKSLYVYKARGVRRKPFLIDRKPADGDEPSRYLTTLCAELGIWLDLALCPTPLLRCPRRRETPRRWKEKFCVPFDKRWRAVDWTDKPPTQAQHEVQMAFEQSLNEGLMCWNCSSLIPDRCEACVHQMSCTRCAKTLCHGCAYIPFQFAGPGAVGEDLGPQTNPPNPMENPEEVNAVELVDLERAAIPSNLLAPCCFTAPPSMADNLCAFCNRNMIRAPCSLCPRQLCMKHELDRCRRCEGGCNRLFCFSIAESRQMGCGELEVGKAGMKDCLGCATEVCGQCRSSYANNDRGILLPHSSASSTPSLDEDDGASSTGSADGMTGGVELLQKTSCTCRTCLEHYYCPECWPNKPTTCIAAPRSIVQKKAALDATVNLYLINFIDSTIEPKWYTKRAIFEIHRDAAENLLAEFEAREKFTRLSHGISSETPYPAQKEILSDNVLATLDIQVSEQEKYIERVLAVKPAVGPDGQNKPLLIINTEPYPDISWNGAINPHETMVLCKWLGRNEHHSTSWEKKSDMQASERHLRLVNAFIERCQLEQQQGAGQAFLMDEF